MCCNHQKVKFIHSFPIFFVQNLFDSDVMDLPHSSDTSLHHHHLFCLIFLEDVRDGEKSSFFRFFSLQRG